MPKTIFSEDRWLQQQQPWLRLIGFLATVLVATYEQWSAEDLAWSFWLAGLVLGLIYLAVYQVAQGDGESLLVYPFFLLFFYSLFAGFLHIIFVFVAWETTGQEMPPLFATIPTAIAHAAAERWPFLITSGLALLPDYVLDARTVDFTDLSKPLFGKDLLRMMILVFLLMALTVVQAGVFVLYAVLLVYFLPWESLRQIGRVVRERLSVVVHQGLGLLLLVVALGGGGAGALHRVAAQSPDATITIDATRLSMVIESDLWGSNLIQPAPAAQTVEHAGFVDASRRMSISLIRWPGGNNADAYDWKQDEIIKPGRRVHNPDRVDIARMIQFARDIGAEPTITVNFGTMTAQDAADLVEFLNGPADSTWGAQRAARGFPDPLNVRFFEIGNEENQPHMWYYSWTAENPEKYFFGGEEERRGFYNNASSQEYDPVGAKGDFFKADGGPNQTYTLRFRPVRDARVFWAATQEDVANRVFEEWQPVSDLSTQPADAKVFTLEPEAGMIYFGDGVHGAMPPAGSYFLVEYTTYGHDGFLDIARAMRAAPSSVPIQIGAATLPFVDGQPITDTARMVEIFQEMDFYVRHQYGISIPVQAYGSYDARRQIAAGRVAHLAETYDRVHQYLESIEVTRTLSIGVTEWNIFLNENYWHTNRTLEGGVIAAEWFIRLLNAGESVPVVYANQFALHGGNLALIRSQTNHAIAPMGYVFQGFSSWPGSRVISTTLTTPTAPAYDMTVPFLVAAAALSPDGRTLRIAAVNNAETTDLTTTLQITGFTPSSARLWRLAADRYDADNEHDPTNVVLREELAQVPLSTVTLPPHSVTFVELRAPSQEACVGDANANGIGDVVDIQTTASEPGCLVYLPLVAANWRQPWPTATPTPGPPQECECAGAGGCGAPPTPQQTLSKLAVVDANEYWIAYESPTQHALSLAWAGDSLWMADVFKGVFYKVQEGEDGLTIIDTVKVRRDPFMQARDLTWDGDNLWSVHWGDVIRHDMTDPELGADLWINEGEIGAPNLHHLKAIAWDGEFIWSALDGTIHRHNKTDFEVAETFQVSGAFSPAGMAFREGDLWVANRNGGFIDRLDSNSFALLDRYSVVQQPFGLAWSDSNLWVYDWYTNRIYKILKLPATSLDPEDDYLTAENYTRPEGIIRGEVTWTRAGSPYVVSDLVIERGATLTIEPGVTVYVQGGGPLSVQGVLNAVGTPDSEIIFTHERPNQIWGGLYFSGEEANASVLEHVRIQYADDGIKGVDAAPHRIAYSVIRKVNVYGLRFELGAGNYGTIEITGNRIEQGAGGAIKMILRSPASRIDRIAIRGNTFRFWYTAGPIIESEVQDLSFPPEIVVEHNIFENGYRGAGGGFPASGDVAFHDNHLRNSISGSGVQPFHGSNEITNNLIEYTFEAPYELHPGHFVTSTTVRGNTVRGALTGFDHNWGDPTIVVEQNNLLAPEDMAFWTGGVGETDGGYDVEMRRNWWGTDDLHTIRAHIFDRLWIEENDPENTDVMGTVWIEPVLAEPNGIGFIRGRVMDRNSGRPISSATITLGGEILHSSATGEFFTSAPQGPAHLTIESPEHAATEYDVRVCSGTVTDITAEIERDP